MQYPIFRSVTKDFIYPNWKNLSKKIEFFNTSVIKKSSSRKELLTLLKYTFPIGIEIGVSHQ